MDRLDCRLAQRAVAPVTVDLDLNIGPDPCHAARRAPPRERTARLLECLKRIPQLVASKAELHEAAVAKLSAGRACDEQPPAAPPGGRMTDHADPLRAQVLVLDPGGA